MSCGCGTAPKVSGTEVTLLSGTTGPARQNDASGDGSEDHKKGVYIVAASAVVMAALAFFVTRN